MARGKGHKIFYKPIIFFPELLVSLEVIYPYLCCEGIKESDKIHETVPGVLDIKGKVENWVENISESLRATFIPLCWPGKQRGEQN